MLVDTHCHLFSEYYDDIDAVIERAYNNNIGMIIVNGYNMNSNREVLELVKKYDIVYGALGIQPEEIDDYTEENLKFIENHINDEKIVAVGEIGLDYHYLSEEEDREKEDSLEFVLNGFVKIIQKPQKEILFIFQLIVDGMI